MLRCSDGVLYTGITTDPSRRLKEHSEKSVKAAKSTRFKTVVGMECIFKTDNRALASRLEYWIKKLTKTQKEQLIKDKELSSIQDKIEVEKYSYYGKKMP